MFAFAAGFSNRCALLLPITAMKRMYANSTMQLWNTFYVTFFYVLEKVDFNIVDTCVTEVKRPRKVQCPTTSFSSMLVYIIHTYTSNPHLDSFDDSIAN